MHQVIYAHLVATFKSMPVSLTISSRHRRMTKLVAVVHVWTPVILIVLASPLNSIVKATPRDFIQLRRRSVPSRPLSVACNQG
jgi:hypothetical protein